MSTNFELATKETNGFTYILDITEVSGTFSIAVGTGYADDYQEMELERLTGDQIIGIALKMLNVVLYSYPEKMSEIVDKLGKLRY